ncbi:MAG: hypothetical protein ACM3OG_07860 [Actinomycetota bacterium]
MGKLSGAGMAGEGAGATMGSRRPTIRYFAMALIQWMLLAGTCRAEAIIMKSGMIEGFGNLTWGIPAEEAEKTVPDLRFGGYEIGNRKEEPVKIFYRSAVPAKIDAVIFDSIDYVFKADRFSLVRGSLRSKIGPRTLTTRAEDSWVQLSEYLVRKFGKPKESRNDYVTEYLVVLKDMRWETGGVFIHLRYRGPEREDEDQLTFEMGK